LIVQVDVPDSCGREESKQDEGIEVSFAFASRRLVDVRLMSIEFEKAVSKHSPQVIAKAEAWG